MRLGLRAILLIVAIVLFIVSATSDDPFDLLALGLACFAGALLVEELGRGAGGRRGLRLNR